MQNMMWTMTMTLGARLRRARDAKGMTLEQVADVSIVEQSGKDRQADMVQRVFPGAGHDDIRRLVRTLRDLNPLVASECVRW